METTLEKLFESTAKVKLLRLFLMNSASVFSLDEITHQAQLKRGVAKKELIKLLKLKFILKKAISIKIPKKKKLKRRQVFCANTGFKFFLELKLLILKANPADKTELIRRLNAVGGIKLAVVAGVFINSENSRVDMLVVGDKIKKDRFKRFLSRIESEIGKELVYVLLTSAEFKYRMDMYDRFLRDIFEFSHEKLINRMNL